MQNLIMHGSYGSPEENWFRWLEQELLRQKQEVILEQFPVDDWDHISNLGREKANQAPTIQTLTSWDSYFTSNILPKIQGRSINVIAHSVAPIFILHMLTKHTSFKVEKALFVAPFFNIPDREEIWQFYPVNKTFYHSEFNFEFLKSRIRTSFVVYGDNDPYVPQEQFTLFAEKINASKIEITQGRHCGSNFKEFPELIPLLFTK